MATPEAKVEGDGEINHLEPKEKLKSVTNHETFSLPEGHEVNVVQHTTDNAEAVMSVSSEVVNVAPPGRLLTLAEGTDVEVDPLNDLSAHVTKVGYAVAVNTTTEGPAVKETETAGSEVVDTKASNVVQDAEKKEEDLAVEAVHPPNCLVDKTSKLVNGDEPEVKVETATQDKAIVPGEEPVCPVVNRPKRPPPPSQEPPQIVPSKSGEVRSQPPASTSDPDLKIKSLRRFREFGSSMRKTFKQVKTKLKPMRKDGAGKVRSTTGIEGSVHDGNSLYSSTDLHASHPTSTTNTPQVTRKEDRITKAIPDLQIAMGDDHGRHGVTAQTTDYTDRLRDRLQRYQTETHHDDSPQPDGHKRKTWRNEVSERSDKISWPFRTFSFRRSRPPKKVYAVSQDPTANLPKTRPPTSAHYSIDIVPKVNETVHVAPPVMVQETSPKRITPPCLSREVTHSNPVLTSLASHKRMKMLQQIPKGIHMEVRPVSHLVMHSDEHVGQAAPLPYFSDSLMHVTQWTHGEAGHAVHDGVDKVHPFLAAWTVELTSGEPIKGDAGEEPAEEKVDVTCLQYYLSNCLKLSSADLQGEFAPFHYPLNDSYVRHWPQCVIFDDCGEVRILREPQLDTEYLELVNLVEGNVCQRTLFYATQPTDRLLTAWLDCQSTVRATSGTPRRETPAYHPVQLVTKLSQVLTLEGEQYGLLNACLRLAVLLAYNFVKTQCHSLGHDDVCLDTDAHRIALFMTTTNCLVAFTRKREEEVPNNLPSNEPETPETSVAAAEHSEAAKTSMEQAEDKAETAEAPASPVPGTSLEPEPECLAEPTIGCELMTLLKSTKCDQCNTSEEAIDSVISEIHNLATCPPAARSLAVSMMRAVVPPDWMAMTLARVCIAKE